RRPSSTRPVPTASSRAPMPIFGSGLAPVVGRVLAGAAAPTGWGGTEGSAGATVVRGGVGGVVVGARQGVPPFHTRGDPAPGPPGSGHTVDGRNCWRVSSGKSKSVAFLSVT